MNSDKKEFVKEMENRTLKFAHSSIKFSSHLGNSTEQRIIRNQRVIRIISNFYKHCHKLSLK
ncbi:MAG: hypothetical protein D8M58_20350 [Calditrichaeota bacterium]|nr:MAG: hypothetical protein DWQ03_14335 [Calditrichota bacterium]MBL1207762.1 hypothetical protein [Calditrichota bacterium]